MANAVDSDPTIAEASSSSSPSLSEPTVSTSVLSSSSSSSSSSSFGSSTILSALSKGLNEVALNFNSSSTVTSVGGHTKEVTSASNVTSTSSTGFSVFGGDVKSTVGNSTGQQDLSDSSTEWLALRIVIVLASFVALLVLAWGSYTLHRRCYREKTSTKYYKAIRI